MEKENKNENSIETDEKLEKETVIEGSDLEEFNEEEYEKMILQYKKIKYSKYL